MRLQWSYVFLALTHRCDTLFTTRVAESVSDQISRQWLYRADSRLAPSQWEAALLSNDVSHWLGASLESALLYRVIERDPTQYLSQA